MARHIILDTAAPSAAPTAEGVHWIKTTDPKGAWLSVGTATVDDWLEQGAGGGGSALELSGNDTDDAPFVEAATQFLDFDVAQFNVDGDLAGSVSISLRQSFIDSLGGGGASTNLYPVWRRSATYQLPAGVGKTSSTAAAISPAFAANRTWVLPFLVTQPATLYAIGGALEGTIPAGDFEFSIQPFPSNPDTPDVAVMYREAIPYANLVNLNENTLASPTLLVPGIYLLYARCSAAAASMTTRQMVPVDSAESVIMGDPLSAVFWYQDYYGAVAMQRNYSAGTLNVGQFPHPFDDGTAAPEYSAPLFELSFDIYIAP